MSAPPLRAPPAAAPAAWSSILIDAVTKPGVISTAYSRFWNYSVGNQLLALFQCLERHLEPGPINTFMGWIELGRRVKKGEESADAVHAGNGEAEAQAG